MAQNWFKVRTITGGEATIVNVCDAELVGTVVKGEGLEMNISYDYFGGELMDSNGALELIRNSDVANLVGKRIVDVVIEEDLAAEEAVRVVGGTAFLMIYRFT